MGVAKLRKLAGGFVEDFARNGLAVLSAAQDGVENQFRDEPVAREVSVAEGTD
ncbi:hypothetical protein D3C84_1155870 [compost metagenome]